MTSGRPADEELWRPEDPWKPDPTRPGGGGLDLPEPAPGDAVSQLLEEMGPEPEPRTSFRVWGMESRVAVVSGGSSGIGRAIVLEMARHGMDVAFTYLDDGSGEERERAEAAVEDAETIGVTALAEPCDVREPGEVNAFIQQVVRELGGVHMLVNNAGIARDRALWHMTDEEWDDVTRTNLSGTFHFMRAVAPHLRGQQWGKIVNVASVHGLRPEFGLANYSASKGGVLSLTRSAAVELGPSNVNVNAVAPGYIRTTRLTEGVPAEVLDQARERSPLGRLGDPQDVAGVVLFLCSEAARHITGAVIPVDGGYLL